ncbi:TPA: ACT domain-containing protein [Candidatus Micrarchaeota archaeon]|nr:ACT domain-containing protein [Candidatus Micrarchaeota archaeon]
MVSVSRIVEKMIKDNPSIEIALSKDLINYSKLARYLRDEVEKETGKKVKDSAIVIALKRISERSGKLYEPKVKFRAEEITSNSNLMEITVVRSPRVPGIVQDIYEIEDVKKGGVVNVSHSNRQTTFIFSEKLEKRVKELLEGEQMISELRNVSQISVAFSEDMFKTPGFIVYTLKELSWHNINIMEIISTYTELVIIVKDEDFMKAYQLLRRVLFG